MLDTLSIADAVGLYNRVAERQIKTFRDRPTALARLASALADRGLELHAAPDGGVDVRPVVLVDAEVYAEADTLGSRTESALAADLDTADAATEPGVGGTQADAQARGAAAGMPASATPSAEQGSPRVARQADHRVIRVLSAANPKREGSNRHRRFALYRDGMTVEEYVAAGGKRHDVDGDVLRGYVALEDAR